MNIGNKREIETSRKQATQVLWNAFWHSNAASTNLLKTA